MFNFNVKDGSLPGGQFYLNVPVSMPEMYVFRSIADVRSLLYGKNPSKHQSRSITDNAPACSS